MRTISLIDFGKRADYEKHAVHGAEAQGGLVSDGVKAHEDGRERDVEPCHGHFDFKQL
jgi:hypothetical protein